MLSRLLRVVTCFVFVCLAAPVEARWAVLEDAPIEVLLYNKDVEVKTNGSIKSVIETRQKILNESGRGYASHFVLYYTEDSTRVKVLEAKTIYNGKEFPVEKSMIEDRPLASSPHGFDQRRQILISFPKMEVGAEIYIKFVEDDFTPVLDGVYGERFYFGTKGYWRNANIKISSKLPLRYKSNDPSGVLEISGDEHNLVAKLVKPICTEIASGSEIGIVADKNLTWVSVSSLDNWGALASKIEGKYNATANQKLPESYNAIVVAARKVDSENPGDWAGVINTVTSMLNERVQYMGDWRSVSGKFFPRPLETVAQSRIGDCKDFATGTVSILRNLGFDADVALVRRGSRVQSYYGGLPSVDHFDHAMVRAKKDGRVYWVDPTNYISMSHGVFEDIAGKMTLVLNHEKPSYEQIGDINPAHSIIGISKDMMILGDGTVMNKGRLLLSGESAAMLSGARLYASEQGIKDALFLMLSGKYLDEKNKISIQLPALNSRIVSDIKFSFEYAQDNQLVMTNIGTGVDFSSAWTREITSGTDGQISDLPIGSQRTMDYAVTFKGVKLPNINSMDYHIDTKWLSVDRKCKYNGEDTIIHDTVIVKQKMISSEDLATSEYNNMKRDLVERFQKSLLVVGAG